MPKYLSMDHLLRDKYFRLFVVIIGIIIVADIVNVFVIGGPSIFSAILSKGTGAGMSAAGGAALNIPLNNESATSSGHSERGVAAISGTGISENSGDDIYVPTKATPIPTVNYVTEVTPVGTTSASATLRYVAPTATQEEIADTFVAIYSKDFTYTVNSTPSAVAVDVSRPPLIINFTVTPDMAHRLKVIDNRTGTKAYNTTTYHISRPSEEAWFTVTIYDRNTGQKIDEDGFGGTFDLLTDNEYTLRQAGSYQIQFNGQFTSAHVDMFLDRDNIASLSSS